MRRSASRLTRILASAAVPVMLVAAGCSAGSDGESDAEATPTAKPSATVAPAKYSALPDACETLGSKTIGSLVPKTKAKKGTRADSSDANARTSCSWNGLEDKGVKGSQYRWLDVSLVRYDSDANVGSGAERAAKNYTEAVAAVQGTADAKNLKAAASNGLGDRSTTITYTLRKTDADFAYVKIVARTENVVLTLSYNGTGYAGAKAPTSAALTEKAVTAAREVLAAVTGVPAAKPAAETPAETPASGTKPAAETPATGTKPASGKPSADGTPTAG
ncbi:DUF3558 domain-containing protein [Streptomyces sp. NPDC051569]|uniref:DUF3558 domain-containing protein n=1 Tax=Streptomyces sp. NPDC051569 TaxID=3365661 RepID=UPI0037943FDE